ncbi:MAG: DNA cytosine methyltransferase [Candidatus Saccharibacteria bacterium]|nr:DNA cytosine methyltransferase [Candidatus Saccharibacteria bacterium]
MAKNNKLTVVSLFSGCGGLDLGLEGGFEYLGKKYAKNPFHIIWANDINAKACKTMELNFPDTEVVCDDITKVLAHKLKIPKADVVVGGFPCQDFSLAGKRQGLTVQRGQLYLSMIEVIKQVQPKVFMAENVKGLLSWENGLGIRTMISDFEKLGYHVEYKLHHTANYGVPQTRERVIIVGVRKDLGNEIKWAEPTHSSDSDSPLKPWVTLKDAIGDLEDDKKHFCLPNSGYSKAKLFPGTQGNSVTKADKPGPTMRAEHHGNIEFHYNNNRRLSAREAARIQSFPDDFVFLSSTTDAYRQVGNAVAPVFGWYLAKTLKSTIDGLNSKANKSK